MVDDTSMPGQVGLYRVLRHLETNELVEVYLGEDTNPSFKGDRVAVKRLRPELQVKDPLYARGFVAEGEVGRHISHPNVAQTYDVVVQDGVPFLVTEYVDGILISDLAEAAGGKVESAVLAEVARQLCEGLAAIHDARDGEGNPLGIVHQSVRPSNVCINRRGDVKLLDLGVIRSKIQGHGGVKVVFDAPAYLSPEQARGDVELTPASDQYAVGVLVFELLCGFPFLSALEALARLAEKRADIAGQLPSDADRSLERLDDVLEKEAREGTVPFGSSPPTGGPERLDWARRELPAHLHDLEELPGGGLDEILIRMLAYDPGDRYPSIREAGADLLRWAWGTGHAIDFRKYVAELIATFRGEETDGGEEKPLDEAAVKEAAESSLVPKSIVLGVGTADSAFLPPPQEQVVEPPRPAAPVNLADPAFIAEPTPAPGTLLDNDATGELRAPVIPGAGGTGPAKGRVSLSRVPPVVLVSAVVVVCLVLVTGLYLMRDSFGFGSGTGAPAVPTGAAPSAAPTGASPGHPKDGSDDMRELLAAAATGPSPAASPRSFMGFRGIRGTEPSANGSGGDVQAPAPAVVDGGEVPVLPPEKLVPFRGRRAYGSGTLTVDTSPTGATVILDGVDVQTSPVTFQNIPAGEHQLILRSEELGRRDVVLISLRNGQEWLGTWSFIQKRWISRD